MKTIRVKQKHIDKGVQRSFEACPIAHAILEQAAMESVKVGLCAVAIDGLPYCLPPIAKKFARDFDKGRKVKPFSFKPIEE